MHFKHRFLSSTLGPVSGSCPALRGTLDHDHQEGILLRGRNGCCVPLRNVCSLVLSLHCYPHRHGGAICLPSRLASSLGKSATLLQLWVVVYKLIEPYQPQKGGV